MSFLREDRSPPSSSRRRLLSLDTDPASDSSRLGRCGAARIRRTGSSSAPYARSQVDCRGAQQGYIRSITHDDIVDGNSVCHAMGANRQGSDAIVFKLFRLPCGAFEGWHSDHRCASVGGPPEWPHAIAPGGAPGEPSRARRDSVSHGR